MAASGFDIVSVLRLGGLPAIKKFCDRLRLAELIDAVAPVAERVFAEAVKRTLNGA